MKKRFFNMISTYFWVIVYVDDGEMVIGGKRHDTETGARMAGDREVHIRASRMWHEDSIIRDCQLLILEATLSPVEED